MVVTLRRHQRQSTKSDGGYSNQTTTQIMLSLVSAASVPDDDTGRRLPNPVTYSYTHKGLLVWTILIIIDVMAVLFMIKIKLWFHQFDEGGVRSVANARIAW